MRNRLDLNGNSILGVFVRSTEDFSLVPREADRAFVQAIEESLHITAIHSSVGGSSILGSLCCGNSRGFLISGRIKDTEVDEIRKNVPVQRLGGIINASGNNILVNDTAALVNPKMSGSAIDEIREFMDVEVYRGTIAGLKTVGMAACITNRGILVHPEINKFELDQLDTIFSLPVEIGTINLGTPQVGSGLIANSKGYVVGSKTTGHEMGRIEEALGFI